MYVIRYENREERTMKTVMLRSRSDGGLITVFEPATVDLMASYTTNTEDGADDPWCSAALVVSGTCVRGRGVEEVLLVGVDANLMTAHYVSFLATRENKLNDAMTCP